MTTETLEINANCRLEVWRLDGCETRVSLECSTYPACHAQSDTTISVDISEEQARQLVAALTSAFPKRIDESSVLALAESAGLVRLMPRMDGFDVFPRGPFDAAALLRFADLLAVPLQDRQKAFIAGEDNEVARAGACASAAAV
jgi:hypothetical protein